MQPATRAAIYAIIAALMFAIMGLAVRYASTSLGTEMIVFLRTSLGLLVLLPWLLRHEGWRHLHTRRLPEHLFRAVTGLSAMYCFFYALAHLQLAEAIILNYSSPLFIAVFALIWLGERASRMLIVALLVGFAGVGLIVKPGDGVWSLAALVGLASGMLAALAMVGIRRLSSTEPTRRIVFYFSFLATLISGVPVIWAWQTPSLPVFLAMAGAGICATCGQLLLTKSYSMVVAARVGPYTYSSVIFAALFGWLLYSETPDLASFAGAILIVSAGILTLRSGNAVRLGS
ncbi:MAG: DMT family transporter [Gammaproteobacteria bacterium]